MDLADGSDLLFGGKGNDVLIGGGNDFLSGGEIPEGVLPDDVDAAHRADYIREHHKDFDVSSSAGGRAENDTLDGGAGDDILYGGAGDDYLDGGEGIDFLLVGADPNASLGALLTNTDAAQGPPG